MASLWWRTALHRTMNAFVHAGRSLPSLQRSASDFLCRDWWTSDRYLGTVIRWSVKGLYWLHGRCSPLIAWPQHFDYWLSKLHLSGLRYIMWRMILMSIFPLLHWPGYLKTIIYSCMSVYELIGIISLCCNFLFSLTRIHTFIINALHAHRHIKQTMQHSFPIAVIHD